MVRCSECGKEFSVVGYKEWGYRTAVRGKGYEFQCGYKCWRARNAKRTAKVEAYIREQGKREAGEDLLSKC